MPSSERKMSGLERINNWETATPLPEKARQPWAMSGLAFAFTSATIIATTILLMAVVTGALYHVFAYGDANGLKNYAGLGLLVAFLYILPFAFRNEFNLESFAAGRRNVTRLALVWTYAFVALGMVAFLTKTTADYSRGWLLLFYVAGFLSLLAVDATIRFAAGKALLAGRLARRRLMLIGTADEIRNFIAAELRAGVAHHVTTTVELPNGPLDVGNLASPTPIDVLLTRALKVARTQDIEGVVLLSDWSNMAFVDRCVGAFSVLPVSIHLNMGDMAKRFNGIRMENVGTIAALALTEQPLAPLQALLKRALDIVVAGLALLFLAPLFGVIALLIRRDSVGPVFFTQRRRGYNQQEFRIYKFRSMTTMDDGDDILQATTNDVRITRIGALLRRFNLDELPQLINVLRGEMSIVGPRPHAVAHDRLFETRIGTYPRRLNVRPGITGWAQVHGLRGETSTDDKMAARVDHDLYYIDNWSIGLDLYILLLTIFSARTYQNAR
jgi:Undecaprenyl-phosphate glucose phosphotransferase